MQWEYTSIKIDPGGFMGGKVDAEQIDAELNRLGREGWELATVFETNMGHGATRSVVFTFKRPIDPSQGAL